MKFYVRIIFPTYAPFNSTFKNAGLVGQINIQYSLPVFVPLGGAIDLILL